MSSRIRPYVIGLPLLFLASCQPRQDIEKEMAALQEHSNQFVQAFKSENADSVMALYWNSPDLVFYPPDTMEANGYDAVHQVFTRFFETMEVKSFELKDEQRKVSGDLAFTWGKYSMTVVPTGGSEMQLEGRYTAMFMKHEGKWMIAVDHASAPLPPPPPPTAMEKKKK